MHTPRFDGRKIEVTTKVVFESDFFWKVQQGDQREMFGAKILEKTDIYCNLPQI